MVDLIRNSTKRLIKMIFYLTGDLNDRPDVLNDRLLDRPKYQRNVAVKMTRIKNDIRYVKCTP